MHAPRPCSPGSGMHPHCSGEWQHHAQPGALHGVMGVIQVQVRTTQMERQHRQQFRTTQTKK
eukprot:1160134-Pelagomonas_calceolata.AAC.4